MIAHSLDLLKLILMSYLEALKSRFSEKRGQVKSFL